MVLHLFHFVLRAFPLVYQSNLVASKLGCWFAGLTSASSTRSAVNTTGSSTTPVTTACATFSSSSLLPLLLPSRTSSLVPLTRFIIDEPTSYAVLKQNMQPRGGAER